MRKQLREITIVDASGVTHTHTVAVTVCPPARYHQVPRWHVDPSIKRSRKAETRTWRPNSKKQEELLALANQLGLKLLTD